MFSKAETKQTGQTEASHIDISKDLLQFLHILRFLLQSSTLKNADWMDQQQEGNGHSTKPWISESNIYSNINMCSDIQILKWQKNYTMAVDAGGHLGL